jgi:hypothetical protein
MGCACRVVTEYLARQANSPEKKRRLHELTAMRTWGTAEWLEHFAEEDAELLPKLRANAATAKDAATIDAQHASFRATMATGRMPSRAALLAHAMLEERAVVRAGLDKAA